MVECSVFFPRPWTNEDLATLRGLYGREMSIPEISGYLNRAEDDVRQQAHELGLTLFSFRLPVAA